MEQIPGRAITGLTVKQSGIALSDPTWTVGGNWTASCVIPGHLVAALHGTAEFRSGNHAPLMGEGRENIRWRHGEEAENDLREAKATASKLDARRLGKIQHTGKWLLVLRSTVNGTELGAQEWRDSLFLSYGIKTPDLQPHCDSCGAAVYICNTMY